MFDNGLQISMGESFDDVAAKIKDYNAEYELGDSIRISEVNLLKDYRMDCSFYFKSSDEFPVLEKIDIHFDVHHYIQANGEDGNNGWDYYKWMNWCKKMESEVEELLLDSSPKAKKIELVNQACVVNIDDLIFTVTHGREYETGIYLSIGRLEDFKNEYVI